MFPELDEIKSRLDRLRPAPEPQRSLFVQKRVEEWTYHSLALDGIQLDLPSVRLVLRHGLTPAGASFDELLRVFHHSEAARYVIESAGKSWLVLGTRSLRELHGLLTTGELHPSPWRSIRTEHAWAGGVGGEEDEGRAEDALLGADPRTAPPDPVDLPGAIEGLFRDCLHEAGDVHALEGAAFLHQGVLHLQPFDVASGAAARLFLNLHLGALGYPLPNFAGWSLDPYRKACRAAARGDLYPFIELLEREVLLAAHVELDLLEDRRSLTPTRVGLRFQGLDEQIELIDGTGRTAASRSPRDRSRAVRRIGAQILSILTEVRKSARGDRFSVRERGSYREGLETELATNVFRSLKETGITSHIPQWHHEAVLEFRPNQASILEADLFFCTFASPEALHVAIVGSILKEPKEVTDEIREDGGGETSSYGQLDVLVHEDVLTLPLGTYPYELNGKELPRSVDLEDFVLAAVDLFLDQLLEGYEDATRSPRVERPRPEVAPSKTNPPRSAPVEPEERPRPRSKFRPLAPSPPGTERSES